MYGVLEATCNDQLGVEVPIPKFCLVSKVQPRTVVPAELRLEAYTELSKSPAIIPLVAALTWNEKPTAEPAAEPALFKRRAEVSEPELLVVKVLLEPLPKVPIFIPFSDESEVVEAHWN